jgi:Domain of unknown function (DUF4328)
MEAPFLPLAGRATWARRLLVGALVTAVVSFAADLNQLSLLRDAAWGSVSRADAHANDVRQTLAGGIELSVVIAAGVVFLMWFHRAYANLRALGAHDLPFGAGWAVGYWFVPILNLVRPKHAANEIWRGSTDGDPVPRFLDLWWGSFLISGILTRVGIQLWNQADGLDAARHATYVLLASDLVTIAAAGLAVRVVSTTTARQLGRARTLGLQSA